MADRFEDHHFYCGECLLPFACPFLVPIHYQLEHEFRCVCDRSFSDRVGLLTHMENVGCRFPFSIEASKPISAPLSTTSPKAKLADARRSFADEAFDAVGACVRKTDDGFSCSICEKTSTRRYRLRQHVEQIHSSVVKKVVSWHLKTVVQKFGAMVGETLACTLCAKPYMKQCNLYEHACLEHRREVSTIAVDPSKIKDQDTKYKLNMIVLRNRFYVKVRGRYRCLICRSNYSSLRVVTRHLRVHGKKLKECLDDIVRDSKSHIQRKMYVQSSREDLSNKHKAEKFKTEADDGSELSRKSSLSLRPKIIVKRPEQELEFLRGYIASKQAFYYCQLCPAKSKKKSNLYQHLSIRHDDILGETLSSFRQSDASLFEHKDASDSVFTPVARSDEAGTNSLGNVVGNVEFHTDVWTSENKYKTTDPVRFNESCDQKTLESQSVSDTNFQRLSVSPNSELATLTGDYGLVKVESTGKLSLASANDVAYSEPPSFNYGNLSATVVTPLGRRPVCSNEVSRSFCTKTRTYDCSICNHKLSTKSGWYKHLRQCRTGYKGGQQRHQNFASRRAASDNQILSSESARVDSQRGGDPAVMLKTSNPRKNGGNDQRMWKCVNCQRQFMSYSGWQHHFVNCKRKHLTFKKRRKMTNPEIEFLRKNVCQKGEKFACRICGLFYRRIYDAFHHIRQKHGPVVVNSGDDTDFKLNSANSQSAVNISPPKVKSEVKSNERMKADLKTGTVKAGLKSISIETIVRRRAYVQSQILEENGRFFCQLCDKSFLFRCYASKHINRLHLRLRNTKLPTTVRVSPVSPNVKNAASTKENRLKVKVLYKSINNNFANGSKTFVKGAKLKTEIGRASFVKSCGLCSKRFLSSRSLTTHISLEHMTVETTPFPCIVCQRSFEKRQYCVRHFIHKHCVDVKGKRTRTKFHCQICDINFPNRACRLQHLSDVHADVCKGCSVCSAVFLTEQDLRKHIRFMHSAKVSDLSEVQVSNSVLESQGSSIEETIQVKHELEF